MAEVPGDELQVVVYGRCRDLKIGVRQHPAGCLELSPESAVDPRDLHIVREHCQGGQHSCLDVPEVARSVSRTVRPLEELADHDRAGELFEAGNTAEPSHVRWQWTASQDFGDRVGVEEEGHSVQRDWTTWPRTPCLREHPDQVLRAFPAADEGGQAHPSPRVSPLRKRHAIQADERGHGLAVPCDDHGFAVLCLAQTVGELRLRLCSGELTRHGPAEIGHSDHNVSLPLAPTRQNRARQGAPDRRGCPQG